MITNIFKPENQKKEKRKSKIRNGDQKTKIRNTKIHHDFEKWIRKTGKYEKRKMKNEFGKQENRKTKWRKMKSKKRKPENRENEKRKSEIRNPDQKTKNEIGKQRKTKSELKRLSEYQKLKKWRIGVLGRERERYQKIKKMENRCSREREREREREWERPTFFFKRLRGPSSGGCEVATERLSERVGEREKERVGERENKRES